jgi:hypothetical protein
MKRDNRIYLEKIKIEFGDFIQLSECCNNKYGLFKIRKATMKLRRMLKEFRKMLIEEEKELNEVTRQFNDKIRNEFFNKEI